MSDSETKYIWPTVIIVVVFIIAALIGTNMHNKYKIEQQSLEAATQINLERIKAGQPAISSTDKHSTHSFEFGLKRDKQ